MHQIPCNGCGHFSVVPSKVWDSEQRTQHLNIVHDQHPTGEVRSRQAYVKDESLKLPAILIERRNWDQTTTPWRANSSHVTAEESINVYRTANIQRHNRFVAWFSEVFGALEGKWHTKVYISGLMESESSTVSIPLIAMGFVRQHGVKFSRCLLDDKLTFFVSNRGVPVWCKHAYEHSTRVLCCELWRRSGTPWYSTCTFYMSTSIFNHW